MRVVTRLHACLAAALIFILYLSFTRDSSDLQDRIHRVWKPEAKNSPRPSSRRLVVFGDDWSDNGEYRVSPPHSSTVRNRDPDQGEMWTETLCKELACDAIDNFARSLPANVKIATIGSVVDTDIFANATAGKRDQTLALFDFRMQVQQFIEYDKEQPGPAAKEGKLDLEGKWSVFTVLFGIWDLLEYASLEKVDAVHAVDRSVEELFHNLNLLVEHLGTPIKVVVPKVVDVTFLPRFQMKKDKSDDVFANKQHESVFLWTYWNAVLSQAAAGWKGGDIFMPDLNAIVMDQVRQKQLFASHISDNSGAGKQEPLFDEVEKPCLSDTQAADVENCSSPARHLFWDSMHLNGPAHQLIGKDAAHLVRDDKAVNRGQGASQSSDKDKVNFDLKFPPGY